VDVAGVVEDVVLARETGGTLTYGYYSYDDHSDVEAVTGSNGNTTATYGYTAYGDPISSMFTGADKSNVNPGPTAQPYSAYRFDAMRWDSSSGQYDFGFRNYDPGLNQFLSPDLYDGAVANMGLTADPFTGAPYAFGCGQPGVEHRPGRAHALP
jgi:RHS repeat-associated protein